MKYYCYIISNFINSVFYTGVTNNISKRVFQHKTKLNKKSFTSKYRLFKLLWFQEFIIAEKAISAEKKIKGWTRDKKIKLIKSLNPKMNDLMKED